MSFALFCSDCGIYGLEPAPIAPFRLERLFPDEPLSALTAAAVSH